MKRRTLLSLLAALGGTGCASVPLSTMMRMSRFNERDFARLDPDVIRVKVTLPDGFALDARRSALGVKVASAAGLHESAFELEQESLQPTRVSDGLLSRSVPATASTLRLAPPSKDKFRTLQTFIGRAPADEIEIRVMPRLASWPPQAQTGKVWIDLLLSSAQGWFTLLDGAPIPLDRLRRTSDNKA